MGALEGKMTTADLVMNAPGSEIAVRNYAIGLKTEKGCFFRLMSRKKEVKGGCTKKVSGRKIGFSFMPC
jgi:hypothetical protein